ncbi:MAG: 3-isopropylmalate dehydratase large subunit, partial [Gammaproteobacteria bacterium]|nr:3-isopropylmalate dehydratase large subunit [Gammaproteobacteria bacterium]
MSESNSTAGGGASGRSMFDKVWDMHAIERTADGDTLLYVDRALIHEGARHAFDMLEAAGRSVARPDQVFAFADHYAPTRSGERGLAAVNDPAIRNMIELLDSNTRKHAIKQFGLGHERHGILHVVPPELGITQPGLLMVGADSHTSTHGALGALAFGVGATETHHVLATQTIWQRRPRTMRIRVDGELPLGVVAKDIILAIIGRIGTAGAVGHAVEYAGSTIESLSMEGRMTVCNM